MKTAIQGAYHPITIAIDNIARIFTAMGFDVVDGPECEMEWYNFDALNVPRHHPSRDMQDTFFVKNITGINPEGHEDKYVMRTHTSNMQIRSMREHMESVKSQITELKKGDAEIEKNDADFKIKESELIEKNFPLAVVIPGKVYRNEATDATHEAQFYQVEMLYVGPDASMAMLKGIMEKFFSEFFAKELKVRLRSSFFPFVEPGCEFDIECVHCAGVGCSVCKHTGWIEIGGAGLVHPHVLSAGNIPESYRGVAFGCGIDRMLMLKYAYDDVRLFYNGDLRVVRQFTV